MHVATNADARVDADVTVNDNDNDNNNSHRRCVQQLSVIWSHGQEPGLWSLAQRPHGFGKWDHEKAQCN